MQRRRRHVQVRGDFAEVLPGGAHRPSAFDRIGRQPRIRRTADVDAAITTGALLARAHLLAVRRHGCTRRVAMVRASSARFSGTTLPVGLDAVIWSTAQGAPTPARTAPCR